jgi:integral membrane protein
MDFDNKIKIFRWISIFEGISFLTLLFLAMPLKYIFGLPQMVQIVGMAHGVLFIAYLIGTAVMFKPLDWSIKTLFIVIACSVLPFGPFYVENKYLKV